jgi:hypothetical protein
VGEEVSSNIFKTPNIKLEDVSLPENITIEGKEFWSTVIAIFGWRILEN